ncbi:unnamed protein product, partial [Polarella glacialis]
VSLSLIGSRAVGNLTGPVVAAGRPVLTLFPKLLRQLDLSTAAPRQLSVGAAAIVTVSASMRTSLLSDLPLLSASGWRCVFETALNQSLHGTKYHRLEVGAVAVSPLAVQCDAVRWPIASTVKVSLRLGDRGETEMLSGIGGPALVAVEDPPHVPRLVTDDQLVFRAGSVGVLVTAEWDRLDQ